MREIQTTITVYKYDELSEEAKDRVLDAMFTINVDDQYWFEFIMEDIALLGQVSGLGCSYCGEFDIDQYDYINIEGINTKLSVLWASLGSVSRDFSHFYTKVLQPFMVHFSSKQIRQLLRLERHGLLGWLSGHTGTRRTPACANIERFDHDCMKYCNALLNRLEEAWELFIAEMADYFVALLRDKHAYQTSREAIEDSISAKEYEFTEDGSLITLP